MAGRLWMRLDGPCGAIRVYVKKRLKHDAAGYFYPDSNVIEIAAADVTTMMMTLFHELLHASLRPYSGHVKEALLGSSKPGKEELVVGAIEPILFDILRRNNLLSFPPPPPKRKK